MNRSSEDWLLERLKQHGADVYIDGQFDSLRDRLAYVIRTNRFGTVIAGKHNGKPESYEALFARIYGVALQECLDRRVAVAGGAR